MLWYKYWLEIRWRMLLLVAVILFVLTQVHLHSKTQLKLPLFLAALQFMWMICPLTLAGDGVRTDSPFRAVKGIQGSSYFTLSLPVSRERLLASRVIFGLLGTAAVVAIACTLAVLGFPEVRNQLSVPDALIYGFTVFLCGFAAYGISTVLATILDQQWQAFASMFVVLGGHSVFAAIWPSSRFDFLRALGDGSFLATHTIPWASILASLAVAAVCLAAAFRIEKARQY